MLTESQNIKNQLSDRLPNTYTSLHNILVVTKCPKTEHRLTVEKLLERLDKLGIRLKMDKGKFVETDLISWAFSFLTRELGL